MEDFHKSQFFQKKYYPFGWRFFLKPEGPELAFLKTVADLFFLFIVFVLNVDREFPRDSGGAIGSYKKVL